MKTIGIVVEYNPFHNGHLYQIEEAKRQTGADSVIVVMSGDFVQRGAPAFIDKYARTQMALSHGIDLVLELPVIYACASAETFAYGAVSLLDRLGIIDVLVFGSECGNLSILDQIADLLNKEPLNYQIALQTALKSGMTYPAARTHAIQNYLMEHHEKAFCTTDELEKILSCPNNILGIEYIKALRKRNSTIRPMTIKRRGAAYHSVHTSGCNASATAIRNSILTKETLIDSLPQAAHAILKEQYRKTYPVTLDDFSDLIYYAISINVAKLTQYPDINEDLANRIVSCITPGIRASELADAIKTKQIIYSRITRSFFHILLGIKEKELRVWMKQDTLYGRILGFKKSSSILLKRIRDTGKLNLITKVADSQTCLTAEEYRLFQKDIEAAHLYQQIVYNHYGQTQKNEYTHGPIIGT